jgi:hypothetical protein
MAKKKKADEATTTAPATSAAPTSTPAAPSTSTDAQGIEAAFAAGNFSLARTMVARASTPEGKAAAARVLGLINVEKETLLVGLLGFVVVLTAAAITLTRG